MPTAYCCTCDWERAATDDEIDDLSRSMIDHHIETGHSPIERRDDADRGEPSDRLNPQSGIADSSSR